MDQASVEAQLERWAARWIRGLVQMNRVEIDLAVEKIAALKEQRKQQPGHNRMQPDSRLNRGAN